MPRATPPPPNDGIYRAILLVLVLSVVAGAAITLAGQFVWQRPDISELGAWIALVSGAIYLVFRWLGAREARRRVQAADDGGQAGGQAGGKEGGKEGDQEE